MPRFPAIFRRTVTIASAAVSAASAAVGIVGTVAIAVIAGACDSSPRASGPAAAAAAPAAVPAAAPTAASAAASAPVAATFDIDPMFYSGLCDASAAIALSPTRFAVINDEDNVLRFFTVGNPKPSPDAIDLDGFLATGTGKEADIEGAAQIGDLVYWISSHGRNKKGEHQERRLRFFATRVTPSGATPLTVEGAPYRDLLKKFIEPILQEEGFTADPDGKNDPEKAPEKKDNLNIEGLAASGESLLIGFRNPQPKVPKGTGSPHALVVELKNPSKLITASPAAPERGQVFRLDLGGRGIRSLEALPNGGGFVIAAGPFDDNGTFALYRWDGTQANPPVLVPGLDFKDFTPEAMFVDKTPPGGSGSTINLTLLSDDGGVKLADGMDCKDPPKTRWRTRLAKIKIN